MEQVWRYLQKPCWCSFVAALASCCLVGLAMAGPPVVSGAVKQGGMVSGTPISIPRPIRLEKIGVPELIPQRQTVSGQTAIRMIKTGRIEGCELKAISGKEMVLALRYRLDPSVSGPVYCGAFLYGADDQAVNAGYKPAVAQQLPDGIAELTMVLPNTSFQATTVKTFLIRNGKIIVSQRFKLPLEWNGRTGKVAGGALGSSGKSLEKTRFCRDYAQKAVAQYRLGMNNQVPGLVPPVWTNDTQGHYDWCLKVPEEQAVLGSNGRISYLIKHLPMDTPGLSDLLIPGLDPGLGP